ncbi:MAG: tRNA-(ms[2]io[6]A)-hydroxylase [Labilithrix sp.]|nr:tRNA-(ms[2]io[6]A)-hydroxylase [Labilithrix sp.]
MLQSSPSPAPKPPADHPETDGESGHDEAIPSRPPWHWVGFGTVAIFAAWLPLAYVAQAVVSRVTTQRFGESATQSDVANAIALMPAGERARIMAIMALPNVAAVALACFGGGYLVGRFGKGTGAREAGTAGAMTALVALVLALGNGVASGTAAIVTALVTLLLTIGFATWGGHAGLKKRSP